MYKSDLKENAQFKRNRHWKREKVQTSEGVKKKKRKKYGNELPLI